MFLLKLTFLFLATLNFSCAPNFKEHSESKEYDFEVFEKVILPRSLNEISGISFFKNSIFSVQDEDGVIFQLDLKGNIKNKLKFDKKADYEDLIRSKNTFYILKSNGKILTFHGESKTKEFADLPSGEYEAMLETSSGDLIILCKECKKPKDYRIRGYRIDLRSEHKKVKDFEIKLPKRKSFKNEFKASAAAQNPKTHDIYVISSIHSQLLVFSEDFELKERVSLSKKTFPQPEGITFDKDANLYISNEKGDYTMPNILIFQPKK